MDILRQVNDVMKSHAFLNYCADHRERTDTERTDIVENIAVKVLGLSRGLYSRSVAQMALNKVKAYANGAL